MFIQELAKRVPKNEIIINHMCPGMVDTNMTDELPIYLRLLAILVKKVRARTPEQGGWIVLNAATVAGSESHGQFLLDKEIDT